MSARKEKEDEFLKRREWVSEWFRLAFVDFAEAVGGVHRRSECWKIKKCG